MAARRIPDGMTLSQVATPACYTLDKTCFSCVAQTLDEEQDCFAGGVIAPPRSHAMTSRTGARLASSLSVILSRKRARRAVGSLCDLAALDVEVSAPSMSVMKST